MSFTYDQAAPYIDELFRRCEAGIIGVKFDGSLASLRWKDGGAYHQTLALGLLAQKDIWRMGEEEHPPGVPEGYYGAPSREPSIPPHTTPEELTQGQIIDILSQSHGYVVALRLPDEHGGESFVAAGEDHFIAMGLVGLIVQKLLDNPDLKIEFQLLDELDIPEEWDLIVKSGYGTEPTVVTSSDAISIYKAVGMLVHASNVAIGEV